MYNLLIADDEIHIRKRLQDRINWSALGITEVQTCDDGDIALKKLQEKNFQILITDIRMPRMDGITLAYHALELNPSLVVIIMSVYDDKEYLKSAIDMQAIGYIEKPFTLEDVESVVKKAVCELNERQKRIFSASNEIPPKHSKIKIDQILDYLHKNMDNPALSLNDISAAHYMSVPYLCNFFKEQTGETLKTYLNNYRLNKACELLRLTDYRVAEISDICGFSDQNYFAKRFTKHFGVSPSKFRELALAEKSMEES